MKLYISEPEPRESGPILVHDGDHNDIAEFFHNEHATVGQSYETALDLVQKLIAISTIREQRQAERKQRTGLDVEEALTLDDAGCGKAIIEPWAADQPKEEPVLWVYEERHTDQQGTLWTQHQSKTKPKARENVCSREKAMSDVWSYHDWIILAALIMSVAALIITIKDI